MTQLEKSPEWTRQQLEMDAWSQMNWFVSLARTAHFGSRPAWEQLKWKEEFAAMHLRACAPEFPVPDDRMRYPRGEDAEVSRTYLPTIDHMQEVREAVNYHLTELADGKGTFLGPFTVSFSVRFHHVHDEYGKQKIPRHIIYRGETSELQTNMYHATLLRHLTRLLEIYCDQIRRCPHCHEVFLQNRRHQEYCSRRCQSVAVMQKLRATPNTKAQAKKSNEKHDRKSSEKRRVRHGKKRR